MNRELKFRAWHNEEKSMLEWNVMNQSAFNEGNANLLYNVLVANKPNFTLMQYTGLHDKNGKEIYEGDIVKEFIHEDRIGRHTVEVNTELVGSIVFCGTTGKWVVKMSKNKLGIISTEFGWSSERFEVIGNIYEHKELITHEQSREHNTTSI